MIKQFHVADENSRQGRMKLEYTAGFNRVNLHLHAAVSLGSH